MRFVKLTKCELVGAGETAPYEGRPCWVALEHVACVRGGWFGYGDEGARLFLVSGEALNVRETAGEVMERLYMEETAG